MEPELFPLFLKMAGRACVVVGAGKIAETKIQSLVRCGAVVRVVAPVATPAIREAAEAGKIVWERRTFVPADLAGAFLVIAATSSKALHEQIFRQARQDGILCNSVDEPERCDFYYPAAVRRGPLQIAISTGGRAPSLAQRLREDLEVQFGPEYGPWTEDLGRARTALMSQAIMGEERRELLRELSSDRAFREFLSERNAAPAASELKQKPVGKVYFLGAGPGDPELLTVKARKILGSAEVVLHDALVAPEIVQLARADAEVCDVGKRCGRNSIRQEEIHTLLIRYAAQGHVVARLQGGDPLIFGRAGEEMTALRNAGIDFEIVPGVTAASAAAAAVRIPLTDRRLASKLVFLSAHHGAGNAPQTATTEASEGENGASRTTVSQSIPASDATLAIYMPGSDYGRIARGLLKDGWAGDTPCVIVSQASAVQQRVCHTEIDALADVAPLPAPAILIVGKVAAVESHAATQEADPVRGDRIADATTRVSSIVSA